MLSNRYLPVFALGITLILMSSSARFARAATINVPADFGTIQGAIDDPNTVAGDEIVVAPGTYNEIIDFLGKAITVRSSGGVGVTTIDANDVADPGDGLPVVRCDNGETATTVLDGFTITGGTGDTSLFGAGSPVGGGMFNNNASPTVTNCTFSGNSAVVGGGMYNFGSAPTVNNCTFSANTTITGSGGGIFNFSSSPTLTNCIFSKNTATVSGGGMYNNNSSPTMTNCTFSGNTANIGGGMFNSTSSPTVTNCTFSGNTANNNGGGMYNTTLSSRPMVSNCTFSGNTANNNGGGMLNNNSSPTMTNCILWGNSDSGGMDESAQIHTISGTPLVNFSDVQGTWTGSGSNNIDANPLFVDADGTDNIIGTEDDDLRLQSGSPCIDAGNSFLASAFPFDLDGNQRIVDDPATIDTGVGFPEVVDMGAYEFGSSPGLCTSQIEGDINCDGIVNLLDLVLMAANFLETI